MEVQQHCDTWLHSPLSADSSNKSTAQAIEAESEVKTLTVTSLVHTYMIDLETLAFAE